MFRSIGDLTLRAFMDLTHAPYTKALIAIITGLFLKIHGPWTEVHWAALVAILADTVVGIWKANVLGEYNPTKLRERTAAKFISYGIPIILAYQIGQIAKSGQLAGGFWGHLFDPLSVIMHAVGIWIAVTEWESVGRSMVAMGKRWPTLEALFKLLRKYQEKHDTKTEKGS